MFNTRRCIVVEEIEATQAVIELDKYSSMSNFTSFRHVFTVVSHFRQEWISCPEEISDNKVTQPTQVHKRSNLGAG